MSRGKRKARIEDPTKTLDAMIPDEIHPTRRFAVQLTFQKWLLDDLTIDRAEYNRRVKVIKSKEPHVWMDDKGERASLPDQTHTIPVYMNLALAEADE